MSDQQHEQTEQIEAAGQTRPARKRRGPVPGSAAARAGGEAMRRKYPPDYYRLIGQLGGTVNRLTHDAEHFSAVGRKGGESTKARHGREHYARIGRIGGKNRWKGAAGATGAAGAPSDQRAGGQPGGPR